MERLIPPVDDRYHLRELFHKYLGHKILFIISLCISIILCLIYLTTKTPLYRIYATIAIKDEKKGESLGKLIKELDFLDEQRIVDNEVEIIKSENLIEKVVATMNLNTAYYEKKQLKKDIPLFQNIPIRINSLKQNEDIDNQTISITIIDSTKYALADSKKQYYFGQVLHLNNSSFSISKTVHFSLAIKKIKIIRNTNKEIAQNIRKNIIVSTPGKNSSILNISLLHPSPIKGTQILSHIISAYNDSNIEENQKQTDTILKLIENRLDLITIQLNNFETKEQVYKTKHGITNITDDARLFLDQTKENDSELLNAKMELENLQTVEAYTNGPSQIVAPPVASSIDPVLSQMITSLSQLELEKENLLQTTGPDNNLILVKNSQIESVRININQNLEIKKLNVLNKISQLESKKKSITSSLNKLPNNERNLIEIIREKNIRENIYIYLLQKREEASLSNAAVFNKMRLIDSPFASTKPVEPKKAIAIGAFLFLGFLFPSVYITFKENLSNKISNHKSALEKLKNWEVVKIPKFKKPNHFHNRNKTSVSEHFRRLRFMMLKENKSLPLTIMVTSPNSLEGKSFISVNLAEVLAESEDKTAILNLDNAKNLTSTLHSFENRDQHTQGSFMNYGLIVLTALSASGNFVLFNLADDRNKVSFLNKHLHDVLQLLKKSYNYVIINTPPSKAHTDSLVVEQYCDVTLHIIRHGHSSWDDIQEVNSLSRENQSPKHFIVYNAIPEYENYYKSVLVGK